MAFGLSSMSIFNSHCNHLIVSHTSTKTNCRRNSISVANYPCFLSLIRIQQPVTCARKTGRQGSSQPSRKLMLELASMVALNLNILPQPLNSLIGEFAQSDGNGIFLELQKVLRGGALNGWRRKKQSSRKLSGFVCVLICVVAKESIQGMDFRFSLRNCFAELLYGERGDEILGCKA
ncbi:uncharacterized protein LOC129288972 isoform X2 [Prosopis cineraria]|uniref:uncharacterized protein LOC129288972 isoform X2 n=1 Tax=Prosopis cineraria TaxID=364024 RepID=UPI00240EA8D9|nr:uncharacterized protein LOC129288972 isoform X2 [Prosopis cineraria]